MNVVTLLLVLIFAISTRAFRPMTQARARGPEVSVKMTADYTAALSKMTNLLVALEEAKPDDYVYGSVNAPSFVLPLAAFGVVALAAIPFLLAPGEEALAKQREDEAAKGAEFNSRKNRDLR